MPDERPGTEGTPGNESGGQALPEMENFGPVTSLEPDGTMPLDACPPSEEDSKAASGKGMPEERGKKAEATRKRARGAVRDGEGGKKGGVLERLRGKLARGKNTRKESAAGTGGGAVEDWSRVGAAGDSTEESAVQSEIVLLDDAFLKTTFKDVHFPATRELCLRYVDMEQDFVYGKDRTVNLHNLMTHLEEESFQSSRELVQAIRNHLARHHHSHGPSLSP